MKTKRKRSGRKTLTLLHDGLHWHAGMRKADGSWTQMQEDAPKVDFLPENILEWAAENGAELVRVALPAELHEFEHDLNSLIVLSDGEIYRTLAAELADKTGMDSEETAPSVAPCSALGMGSEEHRLIGAAFELELVREFDESCRRCGMRFDGLTSLQGLALAAHTTQKNEERESLLFLGEKESFVVGFADHEHQISFRAIPMTCPGAQRSDDYDRRLERRIKPYLHHPIHLITPSTGTVHAEHCLHDLGAKTLRTSGFNQHRTEWMDLLTKAPRHLLDGAVALIDLPPRVKDEKYTGGIICAATIALTVLSLGTLWTLKHLEQKRLTEQKAAIQNLEQTQNSAKSAFNSVDSELKRVRSLYSLLSVSPPKTQMAYTEILTALADALPRYTRVISVTQNAGKTTISGTTAWSLEVHDLSLKLQHSLEAHNLRVVPKTMRPDPDSDETLFTLEVL